MKHCFTFRSLQAAAVVLATSVSAQANICEDIAHTVEIDHGIPKGTLAAIAHVETGRTRPDGSFGGLALDFEPRW